MDKQKKEIEEHAFGPVQPLDGASSQLFRTGISQGHLIPTTLALGP
jgi:hypothetical protein